MREMAGYWDEMMEKCKEMKVLAGYWDGGIVGYRDGWIVECRDRGILG